MSDRCRGMTRIRWKPTGKFQLDAETGESEPLYEAVMAQCRHRVKWSDYCWQHHDQGEYEREIDHAYAAHTAVY